MLGAFHVAPENDELGPVPGRAAILTRRGRSVSCPLTPNPVRRVFAALRQRSDDKPIYAAGLLLNPVLRFFS